MKIACVTGATGLIGRVIIPLLIDAGYQVRALVRTAPQSPISGVEYYCGDIQDIEFLGRFMMSAFAVYHCAAELHDESKMWSTNVLASHNVAEASRHAGVEYFCFISSAGVIGLISELDVYENAICNPRNAYERSKLAAEEAILASRPASRLVILRPTNVVDSSRPGIVGQAIRAGFLTRLKFILKGAECAHLVHAEDVAGAAVYLSDVADLAYGSCYFVSIDNVHDNIISEIWKLVDLYWRKQRVHAFFCLPDVFPYWLRIVVRKRANKGATKYSSKKLISAGYVYKFSVDKIVSTICENYEN